VSRNLPLASQVALFIEVGGGSTEVTVGTQAQSFYGTAIEIGAMTLHALFLKAHEPGPIPGAVFSAMKQHAAQAVSQAMAPVYPHVPTVGVGSSGAIMNLGHIASLRRTGQRFKPGETVTLRDLKEIREFLCGLDLEARCQAPGMDPDRADIILGGAAMLEALADAFKLETLYLTDRGLRDGLMDAYHPGHDPQSGEWKPNS